MARFDFPEERIDIIPNGVPYQQFAAGDRTLGRRALGLGPEDYVVLLVGAGAERKGHAIARAAVRRVRHGHPKLVIVDSPPKVAMPHVYAAADVFLLPTLYDPFANVTLEALAAGLPVITSAQNGASEIPDQRSERLRPAARRRREAHRPSARPVGRAGGPRGVARPAQALAQAYDLPRNLNATLKVFDKLGG